MSFKGRPKIDVILDVDFFSSQEATKATKESASLTKWFKNSRSEEKVEPIVRNKFQKKVKI